MKHVDYMAMSHHALALRCAAAESDHAAVAAAAEAATVAAFLALADAWGGLVAGCNVGRVYVASDRIDILDPSPAVAAWACRRGVPRRSADGTTEVWRIRRGDGELPVYVFRAVGS